MNRKNNVLLSVVHYGGVLAAVCLVSAVSLGWIYSQAKPRMEENIRQRLEQDRKRLFNEEGLEFVKTVGNGDIEYTRVNKNGSTIGYICKGQAEGYSSTISVLVALDPEISRIQAIRVTSSQETPGLGERIKEIKSSSTLIKKIMGTSDQAEQNTPWFQDQFAGKSVDGLRIGDKKDDIEAVSGATVSSKGVVKAVRNAVDRLKTATGKKAQQDSGGNE